MSNYIKHYIQVLINMKNIMNVFKLSRNIRYEEPSVNPSCSQFEVNNWIISRFVIDKLVPIVGVHPFPLNEQMLMVSAVCKIKPSHIFEWGTNIGKSARIFVETCMAFTIDTEIHSIELPDNVAHVEHPAKNRGLLVKNINKVTLHQGDGLETSFRILSTIRQPGIRPLFFLDGDHSYGSVKRELEEIVTKVPKAAILLHDTFYQSAESGYNIGPYRAILDVLESRPNKYNILSQNTGLPGMTLLWQK